METMTLTQLKYVIAVAESKSMNEASKQLFVSQPSLSSAIKELEAETGVEIFRRSNKGVVITPEGEEFIGYARQVVEQYKLIETKYIEKSNEKKKIRSIDTTLHICGKCLCADGKTVRNERIRICNQGNKDL